jgi:hypothetical protein
MISANFNQSTQQINDNISEPVNAAQATQLTNNSAQNQPQISNQTPNISLMSRLAETNIGMSMLKAQLIGAVAGSTVGASGGINASPALDGPSSLSNGQLGTYYPNGVDNGQSHTLFVNGIGTSSSDAISEAKTLAGDTNTPTDLIYQYTDRTSTIFGDIANILNPLNIFGGTPIDKVKKSLDNPAAAGTLANSIMSQLGTPDNPGSVRLIGYSQGAHISAEALNAVNQQLTKEYGANVAKQMMSNVHVLELGGAAGHSEYPPGVNLLQVSHASDPVSMALGDNNIANGQKPAFPDLTFKQHLNYFTDPNVSNIISQWENGQTDNRIIQLNDYNG